MSFVELFKDLEKYIDSPQARWKYVVRVKRGLTDTSQKGGLYKDQVYLEGAVQVLQQRKSLNFKGLLCGKISLKDLKRYAISSILNYEGLKLPLFMHDMDEYMRCLDVIAETNHIETMQPEEAPDLLSERDGETKILDSTINAETFKKSLIIEDAEEVNELDEGREERKEVDKEMIFGETDITNAPSSNLTSRRASAEEHAHQILPNSEEVIKS